MNAAPSFGRKIREFISRFRSNLLSLPLQVYNFLREGRRADSRRPRSCLQASKASQPARRPMNNAQPDSRQASTFSPSDMQSKTSLPRMLRPYKRRPPADIKKLGGFKSPAMHRMRIVWWRLEYFFDESKTIKHITKALSRSDDSDCR